MDIHETIKKYSEQIHGYYNNDADSSHNWYPMFYQQPPTVPDNKNKWIEDNYNTFIKGTKNTTLYNRWYLSENGYVTALEYSPNGKHIIVGHSTGLIQVKNIE